MQDIKDALFEFLKKIEGVVAVSKTVKDEENYLFEYEEITYLHDGKEVCAELIYRYQELHTKIVYESAKSLLINSIIEFIYKEL